MTRKEALEKGELIYDGRPHRCGSTKKYVSCMACVKCKATPSPNHKMHQKRVNDRNYKMLNSTPNGRAKILWNAAKQRAKRHLLPFTITEEFLISKLTSIDRCEVTGDLFDYSFREDVQQNPYLPSLDQRIAGKGYTPENVQIVSTWYNRLKSDMRDDEALSIIKRCREVKTWLFNTQGRT
jgi:hypothetical protein